MGEGSSASGGAAVAIRNTSAGGGGAGAPGGAAVAIRNTPGGENTVPLEKKSRVAVCFYKRRQKNRNVYLSPPCAAHPSFSSLCYSRLS